MTGRYRLAESIGQGGMGRVWRAADEMLDRQVAVKEMRIDGLDPEDTRTRRERTLREARATARIDHPNVVRVYDVVDEGERLWIVMELVAGRSLEQIMVEEGPLGPHEAARIGLGLVAALRQVHAGGVLHRDIKPGNVLVESGGGERVVLTDFGIAAIQDAKALTMVGMLVGSPDYMAPERISGRPQGPPSDVWSLGATLCAALGGRSPFSRDTTLATLHAVLYEEPELPASAGPLRDILVALLEKEPTVRPGLAEVESALRPVAFPQPTPTLPVGGEGGGGEADGAERAKETEDGEPSREQRVRDETPALPWAPREWPTPAFLALPRSVRDESAAPAEAESAAEPAEAAEASEVSSLPSASTESAETRSEVRSETPSAPFISFAPSAPSVPSRPPEYPPGISRARARAVTRRRVPGEFPGPPAPSSTRGGRRRTGILAAAGVLAVGAVTAIVLTTSQAGSGGGDPRADSSHSAGTGSASAGTGTPSPTVEGTSRPSSLPPGARSESGLFTWVPPKGWKRLVYSGSYVRYTAPDGTQEIWGRATMATRTTLLQNWGREEARNTSKGRDYHRIRLEETTFRGRPAVVWEYTVTAEGAPWHARLLGFRKGGMSYEISTWYKADTEARAVPAYVKVRDSFNAQ